MLRSMPKKRLAVIPGGTRRRAAQGGLDGRGAADRIAESAGRCERHDDPGVGAGRLRLAAR